MIVTDTARDVSLPDIAIDKVAFVIVKAREYDEKQADSGLNDDGNAIDDDSREVLEDKPDDPTEAELLSFVRALNEDEKANLVALAWLGRGTFDLEEWDEALITARNEHRTRLAEYLLSLPMLGDYLEEGLADFGIAISDDHEIH
jgi:hypothetical protein